MNDTISRQAAIDALLHNQDVYSNNFGSDPIDRYTIAIIDNDAQTIAQLPSAQPEQQWIPCSERLPEKNCRCLTTNEAWGSFEVDWNAWIDGQWLYPNEKPIAWMPMPEPYHGGEQE